MNLATNINKWTIEGIDSNVCLPAYGFSYLYKMYK